MLKITFAYPDFESLGVEYLMAVCLEDGHQVDFVYYDAEDPYLGRKKKRVSFEQVAQRIADTQPDVVAFSCVTDNFQYQLRCATALKQLLPDVTTVFGGVHPTAVPEKVLHHDEVDCVAIGEAELSFSQFLRLGTRDDGFVMPDRPVKGIVYKKNGTLVGEFEEGDLPELDGIPFAHKAPFFSSLKEFSSIYRIITSRGCPYSCSYCFNSYVRSLRGRSIVRQRSVDNVIDELRQAKDRYDLKFMWFDDDAFTTNSNWILEFCDRYKTEIGLPFTCAANPHYMNAKVVEALRSAGCVNVQIGIQSTSEELCSEILHRKSSNERIAQAITYLRAAGIMVQVDHMLGIPTATLDMEEASLLFYNRYRPNLITIYWLTYYPKIPILETAREMGILTEDDIENIEEGKRAAGQSYVSGGSVKDPRRYYAISLMFNYLPILPRFFVTFLVKTRLYRMLRIKSFLISTAFPRMVQLIFNPKDYRGRSHLSRLLDKTFLARFKKTK